MKTASTGVRRVLILGATSAVAEATARILAEGGARLALVARDPQKLDAIAADLTVRGAAQVATRALDCTRTDDAAAFLEGVAAELGGLDTVLIAYGQLGVQAELEADPASAGKLLDVNFTSAAVWALAAAALMEKQGDARDCVIAVLGSVASDRGRQSNYVYGAAKGGLAILMQGMAHAHAQGRGPRAIVFKLGFVDSPMTAGMAKGGPLWSRPDQVAKAIVRNLRAGRPILYVPWYWRWILLAIRLTPAAIFHRTRL